MVFPPPSDIQPFATGALPVLRWMAGFLEDGAVTGYICAARFNLSIYNPTP